VVVTHVFRCWDLLKRGTSEHRLERVLTPALVIRSENSLAQRLDSELTKEKEKKAQKQNGFKNLFPNPSFLIFKISQSIVKFLV
jgi:hypothetical protein